MTKAHPDKPQEPHRKDRAEALRAARAARVAEEMRKNLLKRKRQQRAQDKGPEHDQE